MRAFVAKILRGAVGCIRALRLARPLAVALVFATALYGLFFLARDISFLGNIDEDAIDRRMDLLVDLKVPEPGETGFAFIDFDAETLARLGDPPLLPPRSVAATLGSLVPLDPRMVLVDVDLTWFQDDDDAALVGDALKDLSSRGIPVLLARGVIADSETRHRIRPALLDPLVEADDNLMWVGVDAHLSGDARVRRVSAIVRGYMGDRQQVWPSPQLAALLIERSGSVSSAEKAFQRGISGGPQTCGVAAKDQWLFCVSPSESVSVVKAEADLVEYTLSWPPKDSLRTIDRNQTDRGTYVVHIPAWAILNTGGSLARETLGQRIVVVGSSAVDRRDLYATPVGEAPGAFILINAIRSWITWGPPVRREFIAGLSLVLLLTTASFSICTLTLLWMPPRFEKAARAALPPLLTAGLWATFYVIGASASAALIVIQYSTVVIIVAASRLLGQSAPAEVVSGNIA